MSHSRRPVALAVLVVAVVLAIALARPVETELLRPIQGGADWSDHLARLEAVWGLSNLESLGLREYIDQVDHQYPPMLRWCMGLVGAVVGHGAATIQRAMVLWLVLLALGSGLVGYQITRSRALGAAVAAGTASIPALGAVAVHYYYDLPMAAWLWLAAAALLWGRRQAPVLGAVIAGCLFVAACLTKWSALPVGAIILGGALLVRLPQEMHAPRWRPRLQAAAALAATSGLLLGAWRAVSTRSWEDMHATTFHGDQQPWGTLGGRLELGPLWLWLPEPQRVLVYPLKLAAEVLSPLLAVAAALLLVRWMVADRRGGAFIVLALGGQLAFLIVAVPAIDSRFLMPALPALILACALGLAGLRPRTRTALGGGWLAVSLLVLVDVHHGVHGPAAGPWSLADDGAAMPIEGRGLSIESIENTTGWVRRDANWSSPVEGEPVLLPTGFLPEREAIWRRLALCDADHLLATSRAADGDGGLGTWLVYRNTLAAVQGEPHFIDVQTSMDLASAPTQSRALAISASPLRVPGWRLLAEEGTQFLSATADVHCR